MEEEPPSFLSVTGWILGSVASSAGMILVNRVLLSNEFAYSFAFSLTAVQYLVTAIGMEGMAMLSMFTRKRLPKRDTDLMTVFCIGSVAFMNFSLQINGVGFYQVTKLLCIPCMVFIQSNFYGQRFSGKTKAALLVVLAGVWIATVNDLNLNPVGCIIGALAVFLTAQFQIWQGDKQKANNMNAMQMTHALAFPSFFVCAALAVLFEFRGNESSNILYHVFKPYEYSWILLISALALLGNLCTYGLIGETSAVTYQVVGHAKTCFFLLAGLIPMRVWALTGVVQILVGIFIALIGVIFYTNLKITESSSTTQEDLCDMLIPRSCLTLTDSTSAPSTYTEDKTEENDALNRLPT